MAEVNKNIVALVGHLTEVADALEALKWIEKNGHQTITFDLRLSDTFQNGTARAAQRYIDKALRDAASRVIADAKLYAEADVEDFRLKAVALLLPD